MERNEIHFGDWQRMFAGEAPAGFYPELLIRAAAIYLMLLVSMGLMGRRMINRLSAIEVAPVVSLGAAAGIPLLSPDRGILAGVVVASVVVMMQRGISRISFGSERFERLSQGAPVRLADSGVISFRQMREALLCRERLLAQLRSAGILHLGQVSRVYLERNGGFTIVRAADEKPGLPVLLRNDREFFENRLVRVDQRVCSRCGSPDSPLWPNAVTPRGRTP